MIIALLNYNLKQTNEISRYLPSEIKREIYKDVFFFLLYFFFVIHMCFYYRLPGVWVDYLKNTALSNPFIATPIKSIHKYHLF